MKRLVVLTGIILTLVVAASVGFAQRAPMSGTFEGSGQIVREGSRNPVNRVEIDLARGGAATITFVGAKRWTYWGRWRDRDRDNYEIDIRLAYGDNNARGTIKVDMIGDRVNLFEVRNGYAADTRFSGDFKVSRWSSGNSNWGGIEFTDFARGKGNYSYPGKRDDVDQLTYIFRRDGSFSILLDGKTIKGTYWRDGVSRFNLDIDGAFGLRNVNGNGVVELNPDRRTVKAVDLDGNSSTGRFRVSWDRNKGNNWDGNFNDYKFDVGGTGDVRIANYSSTVRNVRGDLNRGGRFTITLNPGRDEIKIEGRWSRRDDTTVILDVTRADGKNARGTGTLYIKRDGQLDNFDFVGTVSTSSSQNRLSGYFRNTGIRPEPR